MMHQLAFPLLVLICCGAPVVSAQAPQPSVQLVWMGGNDCPPCVAWRKDELPKLQKSEEFKGITFSYVSKVIRSTVPASFFLPAEVKPYKDKLDYASSGRGGSPQAALIVNGEVFDYFHKTRTASEIEAMLNAVRNNTKYPFERCLKASTEWGKCEIKG
ncbi:MAG: hypothetical protein H7Z77_10945 [Chitinophagaceae bacterium]|nr:hypothetical protein [Polaromonas sp.]